MALYPPGREAPFTSRGYQQLSSTGTAALLSALCANAVLPTGAQRVLIVPSAAIRISDNTVPTASAGIPIAANQPFTYDLDSLATLKVINTATLDCLFFS